MKIKWFVEKKNRHFVKQSMQKKHKDKGEMEEGASTYLRSAPWTEPLDRYPHLEEVFAAVFQSASLCA